MCLLFSLSGHAEPTRILEEALDSKSVEMLNQQYIEFETLLARYATHYPDATFDKAIKLSKKALSHYCDEVGLTKSRCLLNQEAKNIESLLSHVFLKKTELAMITGSLIRDVDESLLRGGIAYIDDRYTQMATSTHRIIDNNLVEKVNDDVFIIPHFDTSRGCTDDQEIAQLDDFRIIDLRYNGGGDLLCTLKTLESFLPKGRYHVATINTVRGEQALYVEGKAKRDIQRNKTVLVNGATASSAEIFAHNLSHQGWDVTGFPTLGKRSIQAKFTSHYGDYFLTIGIFNIPER